MSRFAPFWEILKVVAIVFVSAIIIRGFVAQPFIVEGSSMEPDFHNGEYLLIEKLGYHLRSPARGDVIVFKYPNNTEVNYIKRIVGLPGETVRIFENQVFINGKKLMEDYLSPDEKTVVSQSPETPYEVTLNSDQFFVMGDNTCSSLFLIPPNLMSSSCCPAESKPSLSSFLNNFLVGQRLEGHASTITGIENPLDTDLSVECLRGTFIFSSL